MVQFCVVKVHVRLTLNIFLLLLDFIRQLQGPGQAYSYELPKAISQNTQKYNL